MKKVMTATEIMEMIPNRYPICYIDYVDEMPGVLIIEALAQVGSILILKMDQFEGETAYIGGINKAKFRQKVVPGDVLKLHFEIVKLRDFVGIGKATAYVEDKKVCECELTFIVGR